MMSNKAVGPNYIWAIAIQAVSIWAITLYAPWSATGRMSNKAAGPNLPGHNYI